MIERLQQQLSRPVLEFLQHNEAVHALLALFAPHHAEPAEDDTSIDWEDGEIADFEATAEPAVRSSGAN